MKLLHVVGARPNFPKLAPVHRAAAALDAEQLIVHTGQHYDDAMSESFFRSLGIPAPAINLEVGSGTHGAQTARVMERIEPVLQEQGPDWLVVYGDINSTMAAAIVASKIGVRIAHVEAGLRSGDRSMPEEINRIVTDRLADLLLTPSRDADVTLRAEGIPDRQIIFVGNVMIDSLLFTIAQLGLHPDANGEWPTDGSVLVTLHRPSNVDDATRLAEIIDALRRVAVDRRVRFPMHPRTRDRLAEFGISTAGLELTAPLGYEDMIQLMTRAHAVVTDSGGLQEETTALGIPCLTLRPNTERPVTISEGTNTLVTDIAKLEALVQGASGRAARRPEGWDGRAGERVAAALAGRQRQD